MDEPELEPSPPKDDYLRLQAIQVALQVRDATSTDYNLLYSAKKILKFLKGEED